jgi:hypothetical protein
MSKWAICRWNVVDRRMRAGRSCGRIGRSERELPREFHTPWKQVCIAFPTLSTWDAVDGAGAWVQDVETMLALALAALTLVGPGPRLDPQHLPLLPPRGLVRQERRGVALETLRGAPLGRLATFHLTSRLGMHGVLLEDRRGHLFAIDLGERRVRRVYAIGLRRPAGCYFADAVPTSRLFVCGRVIKAVTNGRTRTVARAPSPGGGAWQWAEYARPAGTAILAQWLGECESPTAFAIVGGKLRPYGGRSYRDAPESFALGWLPGQYAVVHFPAGVCGRAYRGPGVYAVPLRGRARLLRRLPRTPPQLLAMWGG